LFSDHKLSQQIPADIQIEESEAMKWLSNDSNSSKHYEFGPFFIKNLIAIGGIGAVFHAVDQRNNQNVALKVLKQEHLKNALARRHFLYQSHLLSQLNHPNIVQFLDKGIIEESPYLSMELIRGFPLSQWFSLSFKPDLPEIIQITIQIAEALQHAHDRGIIHGDVKPSNVMIIQEAMTDNSSTHSLVNRLNMVKVIDFSKGEKSNDIDIWARKFKKDILTPAHAAPEQFPFSEMPVDHRADIFGLGLLLERLMQNGSFASERTSEFDGPPSDANSQFCESDINMIDQLKSVIDQALNKDPDQRFQTMKGFINVLNKIRSQESH
jgi:serine/threonine protein kinase